MADLLPFQAPVVSQPTLDSNSKPLWVDAKGIAELFPIGLRTIRSMDAAGKIPRPTRIGGSLRAGRVVWELAEIEAWFKAGCPSREDWEIMKSSSRK